MWLEQRPLLRELIARHGLESLLEYATQCYQTGLDQPQPDRQREFLQTFASYAAQTLPTKCVALAVTQLQRCYALSTADHHIPVFPAFAFQANALTAAAYAALPAAQLSSIIVLGCSSVSLNHHDWPRGLNYSTITANDLSSDRVSLFPSKWQMRPVYNCPVYTAEQVTAAVHQVEKNIAAKTITPIAGDRLQQLLREDYAAPDVLAAPNYSAQVTLLNVRLWSKLNPWQKTEPTELFYINEEGLVSQLLLEHHLHGNSVIHNLIFSTEGRQQWLPSLAAAMGSYLKQHGTGTDLFWGMTNSNQRRVALHLTKSALVSVDPADDIYIELTPSALAEALVAKQIFPNLMLCYVVLYLYYQLNCFGGFNQMHYLAAMQQVYQQCMGDQLFQQRRTGALHYGLLSAFTSYHDQAVPLSGLDQWLYGSEQSAVTVRTALQTITIEQSLRWMTPAFVRYLPATAQQGYDLATLTRFQLSDSIERTFGQPAIVSL
jgi:hypothetical protein